MIIDSTGPHDAETDLTVFEVFEVGVFDCPSLGKTRRRWLGIVRDEEAVARLSKGRTVEGVPVVVLTGYPLDGVTEAGDLVPHPERHSTF